ncbi:dioxygenase family protein [Ekhidna lutea]|uniref:dioxygenase family protein n=1 Tax=Ekhidna lutea TaxID=447679 RepID=UPI000B77337E|nr:hypothetical protein [Ekhidna lutea]
MKSTSYLIFLLIQLFAFSQSEIKIIEDDEPGIPFTYELLVMDSETKKPISGAEVYTYQTNHIGDYESERPRDARISGTLYTDANGKGKVVTIFPRGYNDAETGEHIHYTVKADGYNDTSPTLIFADYYNNRYDFDNPYTYKAYLKEMKEKEGKRTGTIVLFLAKE